MQNSSIYSRKFQILKHEFQTTIMVIVKSLKENKVTIREASELLGIEYWEMQEIMAKEGVTLININQEEIKRRQKKNRF